VKANRTNGDHFVEESMGDEVVRDRLCLDGADLMFFLGMSGAQLSN